MDKKRKQYYVVQYDFEEVYKQDGVLHIDQHEEYDNEYSNSENLLFDLIYRLQGKEYDKSPIARNRIPELFILKANNIKKDKDKAIYEKLVREGVHVGGIKYVYSEKSSSMTRTQKTVYIKADIKNEVEEYITLGKTPDKTVVAKWLSTRGLLLSSANLMQGIPNIVIIPDFEKVIYEDVKMIMPYSPTEEEQAEYESYLKEKKIEDDRVEQYYEKIKQFKEKNTQEILKSYSKMSGNVYKSRSKWQSEGKRIKVEELENFKYVNEYKGSYYPLWEEEQTEEIKVFLIDKFSLGSEVVEKENHPVEINCFDGMGLMSFEFASKIREFLGDKNTNAIQGRLPYFKGLIVKFDIKKYFKEVLKINIITDMWGNSHSIDDIDILATESCFKAKLDKSKEGMDQWLFKDMDEYYRLLNKYEYKNFGIANYADDRIQKYAPMTYQLINALNLELKDLFELSKEAGQTIKKVYKQGDTAYVKLFLDMIEGRDCQEDEKQKIHYIRQAIELNERIIFDKEIQKFLYLKVRDMMEDMMVGRIRIPASYMYVTGDIIGFCEWAAYREANKVKGFLDKDTFFCSKMYGEKAMVRYPLSHSSEIKIGKYIKYKNPYLKHLHNVIQLNMYDSTMPRMAGMDVDGDLLKVIDTNLPLGDGKTFKDAIVEDVTQVDPDDKVMAKEVEFNINSIWDFEEVNLKNETGRVTNINTTLQDKAFSKGDMLLHDIANRVCKLLQGQIIDSAKTGQVIEIPQVLNDNATKLPYYFKFVYGKQNTLTPVSPLAKFAKMIEDKIKTYFVEKNSIGIEIEEESYLDINDVHELMIDKSKYDSNILLDLINELTPVHNDYSSRRGELYKELKKIDKFDKEEMKLIKKKYAELNEETRIKAIEACNEVCKETEEKAELFKELKDLEKQYYQAEENGDEEKAKEIYKIGEEKSLIYKSICNNPSVLASASVIIGYELSKESNKDKHEISKNRGYSFPWIVAPEGIIENLKSNEDKNKVKLLKIGDLTGLNNFNKITHRIVDVKSGIAEIDDKKYKVNLEDGKVAITIREGEIYAITNETEEVKIEKKSAVEKSDKELKKLNDYKCKLMYLKYLDEWRTGEETAEIIDGKDIELRLKDDKYPSIYLNGEFVATIVKQDRKNIKDGVIIEDYINQKFKVKVSNKYDKSIEILMDMVS